MKYNDIYFTLGVDKRIRIWYYIYMVAENKNTEGNKMTKNQAVSYDQIECACCEEIVYKSDAKYSSLYEAWVCIGCITADEEEDE